MTSAFFPSHYLMTDHAMEDFNLLLSYFSTNNRYSSLAKLTAALYCDLSKGKNFHRQKARKFHLQPYDGAAKRKQMT